MDGSASETLAGTGSLHLLLNTLVGKHLPCLEKLLRLLPDQFGFQNSDPCGFDQKWGRPELAQKREEPECM